MLNAAQVNGLLAGMIVALVAVMSALTVWTNMRGDPWGTVSIDPASGHRVDAGTRERQLHARYLWQRGGHDNRLAAERILNDVVRAAPDYADALAALAGLHVTGSDADPTSAARFARAALAIEPGHAEALAALGRAAASERRWHEALEYLHRAAALQPASSLAEQWLGEVLAELGYLEQARDRALRALEIEPARASANRFAGEVFALLGEFDQAQTYRDLARTFGDADSPLNDAQMPAQDDPLTMLQRAILADNRDFALARVWRSGARDFRSNPGFVTILDEAGVTAIWRELGPPDMCRPNGETWVCE